MSIPSTRHYLKDTEVAARYSVHRDTPWRWCKEGRIPAPIKLGPSCTRWRLSDLEQWEERAEAVAQ